MKSTFMFLTILLTLFGCTENQKARNFGGNADVSLPQGQKLVMITWKDDDMWYLTKPMLQTDSAETYTFQESSSFGVWNGTVTVKEVK